MTLRLLVCKIAVSGYVLVCCFVQAHAADSLSQTLLGSFAGNNLTIVDVAVQLSQRHVPVGVESVGGPEGPRIDLALEKASVADVLNAAVLADPRYEWKESNGVINLFLKGETNSIFNVIVDRFEAKSEWPLQLIQQILKTPNVSSYLARHQITAGAWFAGSLLAAPGKPLRRVEVALVINNETLQQALNDVLIKSGTTYWSGFYDQVAGQKHLWVQTW